MKSQQSIAVLLTLLWSANELTLATANGAFPRYPSMLVRGGSTRLQNPESELADDNETQEEELSPEVVKKRQIVRKYRMEQQMLMQLRWRQAPEVVDWDCAMSTPDEPKTCLYSFDAEPNTKVIAPLGTTQWISLQALNRLRRTDPTKVEPMWHSQYAIGKSWFGDDSPYSILQHCGPTGLILSLLLDHGAVLKTLLILSIFLAFTVIFPVVDSVMNRILVSSTVWGNWPQWARIIHAALPLKLLMAQMGFKFAAGLLNKVEQRVKDALVELECNNLEATVPLTVGPGSEVVEGVDEFQGGNDEEEDEEEADGGAIVLDEDFEEYGRVVQDDLDASVFTVVEDDDDAALDEFIAGLVGDDFGEDEDY
ncbi:hypothetical protein MHU86_14808 [Fragilaria crotonensis]|nr:hypothetical protein MHU86_14808 [Fragilaria crotonensis]